LEKAFSKLGMICAMFSQNLKACSRRAIICTSPETQIEFVKPASSAQVSAIASSQNPLWMLAPGSSQELAEFNLEIMELASDELAKVLQNHQGKALRIDAR
jgi:hypothetical protein